MTTYRVLTITKRKSTVYINLEHAVDSSFTHYFSVSESVLLTSNPFTIFSILLRSLGDDAVSGFGETVSGLTGGEVEVARTFPEGELLRLLVWELGVTVSNALPNGDEPGRVYGANLEGIIIIVIAPLLLLLN